MSTVCREFYRAHITIPLRCLIVTAICVCAMLFTGTYSNDKLRIPAAAASVFLAAVTVWALADVLYAPKRFRAELGKLPERERGALLDGLESAKRLGKRWFSEEYLVYFAKRRILFFRYDEMCSADLDRKGLSVALSDGRRMPFPFGADENPAVLVAVLRSRCGTLRATVDGSEVDFDKKTKEKRTRK